ALGFATGCARTGPSSPGSGADWRSPDAAMEDRGPGAAREPATPRYPDADDARADGMYAYTEPGEVPQIVLEGGPSAGTRLPLEHSGIVARARGPFAEVKVKQRFSNPHPDPIEVTYTFPLPENSAVSEMRMKIGRRTIE